MLSMETVSSFTMANSSENSFTMLLTSLDSAAMVCVDSTTSASSRELSPAWVLVSFTSRTICEIMEAIFSTCFWISLVMLMEESVFSERTAFCPVSSSILFTTVFALCLFSSARSRTTVTSFTMSVLEDFTASTVERMTSIFRFWTTAVSCFDLLFLENKFIICTPSISSMNTILEQLRDKLNGKTQFFYFFLFYTKYVKMI